MRVQVVFPWAGIAMVQRVSTVAFEGIEARAVDVQVQVAPGMPAFNVVGLPDKAVSEARERVRSAQVQRSCQKKLCNNAASTASAVAGK